MENFNKPSTSIKNWAEDDRPREKLLKKGTDSLSDSELLAILIATGYKDKSAVELAKDILQLGQNNLQELGRLPISSLQKVKGIGEAKAITIAAALEIGRRRHGALPLDKLTIKTSAEVANFIQTKIKDYTIEVFGVIFLNTGFRVNHFEIISKGGISATVADPRIIMRKALEHEATFIIVCHNHPSGNLQPSKQDIELTQKLKQAALFFDIKLVDHFIVSEAGYYSFADEGLL